MSVHKRAALAAGLILLALVGSACNTSQETRTIRVGLLPILDGLPIHVAEAEGYFAEEDVQVEIIPVQSGGERDQLMQAGQIDAMINELVSVLFYNKETPEVAAVRFARVATHDYPVFRIVASNTSGITDIEELKGVPIGISEGTVIEYTTDRILAAVGFTPDQIVKLAVPRIPDRLNLLESGQLDAANLPDPAASIAVERAVEAINEDKARWDPLMLELGLLPPPLVGQYQLPDYPLASVPSRAQFDDAFNWASENSLVDSDIRYQDSVRTDFLP